MKAILAGIFAVLVVTLNATSYAAPPTTEREISLASGSDLSVLFKDGTPTRINGFAVASFSWNSHLQMVPEFAGGASALADPRSTNFRFDKAGIVFSRVFAPWLTAAAAVEVESHRDSHSHAYDPAFGCSGTGTCVERFGAEVATSVAKLDKFNVTAVAPLGNGLALSIGRFDTPFGIERHDNPLLLTATTSEVFWFGRPNFFTGLQAVYQFNPRVDTVMWVANRWESETRHEDPNDNNKDKSLGFRVGISPAIGGELLNFGIGGFWAPEQNNDTANKRTVVDADATWSASPAHVLTAELVWGEEDNVSFRERGTPFPEPAVVNGHAKWHGATVLLHYDVKDWLGLTTRYGYFKDDIGARTGVTQELQSITLGSTVHLSRLIPGYGKTGATYARTQHAVDWIDLRFEYRYNWSNKPVFSSARPATNILDAEDASHQLQFQTVVNF